MQRMYSKIELSHILYLVGWDGIFDRNDDALVAKMASRVYRSDPEVSQLLRAYLAIGIDKTLDLMVDKQCALLGTDCLPIPVNKLEDFL
jgi:hypothetical protein